MTIFQRDNPNTSSIFTQNTTNAINYAINLQNTLEETILPNHCYLDQYPNRNTNDPTSVHVYFHDPNTPCDGYIEISDPSYNNNGNIIPMHGFAKIRCSIRNYNGYFMELVVYNMNELLQVMQFCQQLLSHQLVDDYNPDIELEIVYIPQNMMTHWFMHNNIAFY